MHKGKNVNAGNSIFQYAYIKNACIVAKSINMTLDENTKHMRDIDVLNKLSSVLNRSLSVDEVLNSAISEILNFQMLKIEQKGAILLLNEKTKTLKVAASIRTL